MNDFVRRRYPGQPDSSNPHVRVVTARKNSKCFCCDRAIVAGSSQIALSFLDKRWVHITCLSQVART